MAILNNFPGGSSVTSKVKLTPDKALEGNSFIDSEGELVDGTLTTYGDDDADALTITPGVSPQVLEVAGKYMAADITVNAVSNDWRATAWSEQTVIGSSLTRTATFTFEDTAAVRALLSLGISNLQIFIFWQGSETGSITYEQNTGVGRKEIIFGLKNPGADYDSYISAQCVCYGVSNGSLYSSTTTVKVVTDSDYMEYTIDPDARTLTVTSTATMYDYQLWFNPGGHYSVLIRGWADY